MRHMAVGVAFAISLIALLGTTGCASAGPQAEEQVDAFAEYIAKLRELPGVDAAEVNANEETSAASLGVTLNSDVEPEPLNSIGATVSEFIDEAGDNGFVPSEPQIRLDDSTYSYFSGLEPEEVGEQLNYWVDLHRAGVNSVRVRTFTATASVPALGSHGQPADLLSAQEEAEQPPRYVLVDLPEQIDQTELQTMVDDLATIDDPGAPEGQWDFLNLAPNTKGEYADPGFPSTAELGYAITTGNHFNEVAGLANVEVVRDHGDDTPLRIRIAVFDDIMDGVASSEAETTFQETEAWWHLIDLVALLEGAGALDYGVEVLANPLTDGGNFQLRFAVHGCEFSAGNQWPMLAEYLTDTWAHNVSAERYEVDPECEPVTPDPESTTEEDGDDEHPEQEYSAPDSRP
ncbi:MAG: hypothetical protein ACTHXA_03435 [Gulosibacter sp.]